MTLPEPGGGIRARGIRRSFGPVHAVQGIDLDAPPGQVTALVGPNGAGETTRCIHLAPSARADRVRGPRGVREEPAPSQPRGGPLEAGSPPRGSRLLAATRPP